MSEIHGMGRLKHAIEIAVAGGHHLLLVGAPEVRHVMTGLGRRIGSILPLLGRDAAVEAARLHNLSGQKKQDRPLHKCPVRMPHHTVSVAKLLGGGSPSRPGEISLAHGGVLFLDGLSDFPRACLTGLYEPLNKGTVTYSTRDSVTYPARFQLIATMSPCPCGFHGHPLRVCMDSSSAVQRHWERATVLRPYFDMVVRIENLTEPEPEPEPETSETILARVVKARTRQLARCGRLNAALNDGSSVVVSTGSAKTYLKSQVLFSRIPATMRVAQTLQDLAGNDGPIELETMRQAADFSR